jgi:hypothetical protein
MNFILPSFGKLTEKFLRASVVLITIGLLTQCKPHKENFIGKEYISAPSDLEVTSFSATQDPVNLSIDSVAFSGQFNHQVSFKITLTGLTSGAKQTIDGLSDHIDPNLIKWGGNHEGLYFFQKEDVEAVLTFLNSDIVLRDTFTVTGTKKYDGLLLFFGFESPFVDHWPQDFSFKEDGEVPPTLKKVTMAVQGKYSFYLSGHDANTTYFIGGMRAEYDQPKTLPVANIIHFTFDSYNPDSVYFNAYIYGTGVTSTRMSVALAEDDNGNGMYEDPIEDTWEFPIHVDWVGWKLVSVRYADFTASVKLVNGGNGNHIKELDKVKSITFNLLSDPPGGNSEYYLDFPIVTYGVPFDPHE